VERSHTPLDLGADSKVYRGPVALRVSELAGLAGVSPDTIRYYEKEGLLPKPTRSPSGYRQFEEDSADRVRFIKYAQGLGLKLAEIRELLEIHDKGACPCGHTKMLLQRRLKEIDQEVARLGALKRDLAELAELECAGDKIADWTCVTETGKERRWSA
jgi:MerR family transcriptional regulator, mercuric resistance operon regulatory protein